MRSFISGNTYRANKYRRQAWADLASARDIKARAAIGQAYDWELPRIVFYVKMARSSKHIALQYRRMGELASQDIFADVNKYLRRKDRERVRCPKCGELALDGHITCGRFECDEHGTRRERDRQGITS